MSLEPRKTKLEELRGKLYAKAKAEPEFRFYILYDKFYRDDVLQEAYRQARSNRGAAGVDGETFESLEAYGVERWLKELQEELKQESYRPKPVRRVMIPKPGGGERPLGIPTIRDRVAQTAAKLILEPIFEADMKEEAYGYRPERGAIDAVKVVLKELREGRTQVVDADLTKYFDSIPHALLMKSIARRIADRRVLHIIKMWLQVQVQEKDERGNPRLSGGKSSTEGTPQGGVISPLLANIYINRLLKVFGRSDMPRRLGARIVNYADDFVVLCRRGAPEALEQVRLWVTKMGLQLNESKTCIRDAGSETFKFLGYDFGPLWSRSKGKRYIGATVSKKAMERIREKVSAKLHRGRTEPWDEISDELTRMIRGWVNYFHFGSPTIAFEKLDRHIVERARNLLRRRHKEPRDTPRFGTRELHKEYRLVSAVALLRLHASV